MKLSRTVWPVVQAGVPVILVGDYGIGKTTVTRKFTEWLDRELIHVPLLGAAPEDLIGYPMISVIDDKKYTVHAPYIWFEKIRNAHKKYVLLLDEIGRLDQDRMQNCVASILDRSIGQYALPADLYIFGTTNEFDIGGLNDINYNILSRAAWYSATTDLREERKALLFGYSIETEFRKLPINWKKYLGSARAIVNAFAEVRATAFQDTENTAIRKTPWPSPRSIQSFLIPGLAACLAVGYDTSADFEAAASACCGPAFGNEFATWMQTLQLPKIEEVVKQLKRGEFEIPNRSLFLMILQELANYVNEHADRETLIALLKLLDSCLENKSELVLFTIKTLLDKSLVSTVSIPSGIMNYFSELRKEISP